MVPFAGWSMPFTYEELSVFQSVHHTRKSLSMFDVSHMLQVSLLPFLFCFHSLNYCFYNLCSTLLVIGQIFKLDITNQWSRN